MNRFLGILFGFIGVAVFTSLISGSAGFAIAGILFAASIKIWQNPFWSRWKQFWVWCAVNATALAFGLFVIWVLITNASRTH